MQLHDVDSLFSSHYIGFLVDDWDMYSLFMMCGAVVHN